jgi:HlyD family secretion protein
VRSAQAKLEQLLSGPQDADLVAAQSALTQAQNSLALKLVPYTDADLLAQQQAVRQAEANLQQLLSPSTPTDLEAQRQSVRSAQASLNKAQTPYLPADILSAQAGVEQAQANLDEAQTNLNGAVITAPFDGMISAVGINAGETATGDTTAATSTITLVDPTGVRIDVQVDESDVAQLSVGQTATVTFDALGGRPLQGTVTAISPTGTTTQGVVGYQVSIVLQQARGVRPGMTATAQVVTNERDDVLMIPNRALARIQPTGGGTGGQPGATGGAPPGGAPGGAQGGAGGAQARQGGAQRGGGAGAAASGADQGARANAGRPAQVRVQTANGVETRTIQVGLANDQNTEVISGLEEGEEVVLPTTAARASVPGAGPAGGNVVFGGGGGAVRRP